MSPQLTDADIARHDATAGKVLTDADITALDNHPPAPGIGQQLLDVGTNTLKDVGAGIYGASATANKLFANLAMMGGNVLKNTAGIEASAPLLNLESYFRRSQQAQQQEAQRLAGGRNDLASQINRGLTQGVLELPQYAAATALAAPVMGPAAAGVAGMAAIGGISEADQGWIPALRAAAEGALTGSALHVMGPASQAIRLTGAAAMTYAQARLNGADNETALAHATTMGLMAGHTPGGVTAREFVPGLNTAIETGGRIADATRAGARAAGPDVGIGAAKAGAGYLAGEAAGMVPGGGFVRHMLDIPTALVGARQIGRGFQKGYQAARTAYGESAPPEVPAAAEPGPGPAGAPTDDAVLHLYSVETDPAKRAALRTELIDRGLMNDPNAPAAPGDNPYRGYTQTALRNVYGIEPDPAKRALIEQAARARGLSLLNQEGRRATAAPPETAAEERGPSLTQDDVLLLRYLGEENPLNADAETIGIARQLAAEKPDLLPRLRSGAPEPPVAPVTPAEAAAPTTQAVGTLEYNAPGAAPPATTPGTGEEGAAPAPVPPEEPPPPPGGGATPVPPKGAEIAAQLEESMRAETLTDYLVRNKIPAEMVDEFGPKEWEMVSQQAGVQPPTPEHIDAIRRNLAEYEGASTITAKTPGEAAAEFEVKKKVRAKRKPKEPPAEPTAAAPAPEPPAAPAAPEVTLPEGTTPAQALADLMGPQPQPPGQGTPAPTASEIRVESLAKHLAEDKGINIDDLATVAEKPAALEQLDKLREALGIDGAVIGYELPQIIDRVRQLRGEPPAPAGGEPAAAAPEVSFKTEKDPEDPGTWNVQVHAGNQRIGSMDLIEHPTELEVDLSHLQPQYRGKGYGKSMYQQALQMAQKLGKSYLTSASEFTPDAARVWKSLGGEQYTDEHGDPRWRLPVTPAETLGEMMRGEKQPAGWRDKLNQKSDDAQKRIDKFWKEQGTTLNAGLPVHVLADYSLVGARKIIDGTERFTDWSRGMVETFGEQVRPHLRAIYNQAQHIAGVYGWGPSGNEEMPLSNRLTVHAGEVPEQAPAISQQPKPHLVQKSIDNLDTFHQRNPAMFASKENYIRGMNELFQPQSGRVPIPPENLLAYASDGPALGASIDEVSPRQRALAEEGLKAAGEVRDAYAAGTVKPVDTGLYFAWGALSPRQSPYPQEAGFLHALDAGVEKWIDMARNGQFDESTLPAYLHWAARTLQGTPGAQATSNLNAFGRQFLMNAGKPVEHGPYKGMRTIDALHEIIADQSLNSVEARRRYQQINNGLGVDNKVFSFILLVTGHPDTLVADRVRINDFWDAPGLERQGLSYTTGEQGTMDPTRNLYDNGFSKAWDGITGLGMYESSEKALMDKVRKAYAERGIQDGTLGRWHWETWLAKSGQEVSHGSLGAIAKKGQGMNAEQAAIGEGVRQGKYNDLSYGVRYERTPDGFRYNWEKSDGTTVSLTPEQHRTVLETLREMRDKKESGYTEKERVIPYGTKTSQATDAPWRELPGINQSALDRLLDRVRSAGKGSVAKSVSAGPRAVPNARRRSAATLKDLMQPQ